METKSIRKRIIRQWLAGSISLIVIALGWKYKLLGLWVAAVMLTGIIGGYLRGRWVCGNVCPRGGIFDRLIAPISLNRPFPKVLSKIKLRWFLMPVMFAAMGGIVAMDPANPHQWGFAMWIMCTATTVAGVILGIIYNPRFWCVICPIGNLANAMGSKRTPRLSLDRQACKRCRLCHTKCPMQVKIIDHLPQGTITDSRCIQCGLCKDHCPAKAIQR